MQAVFRFNGSEEIIVNTLPGAVEITRKQQEWLDLAPKVNVGPDAPPQEAPRPHWMTFTKAQARSVASALMQAASEL